MNNFPIILPTENPWHQDSLRALVRTWDDGGGEKNGGHFSTSIIIMQPCDLATLAPVANSAPTRHQECRHNANSALAFFWLTTCHQAIH